MGLFSGSIPPWFVLSNNLSTINTRAIWLCFGAFLSPPASSLQFHWPLITILPSHAPRPRRDQRGQVVRKPFPAGYCLTPTADLAKTERGPISTSGPFLSVWHQTGRSLRKNQSVCPRSRRWLSNYPKTGCNPRKIQDLRAFSDSYLAVIGTRRYPCGGDIGCPDDVPTVALEVLSHCASATTCLLQG